MRARCAVLALCIAAALATPAAAQFSGDLAFTPETCKAKKSCILKFPLTFVDAARRTWRAEAGGITDGASIPDWAQGVIGGRWDDAYIKAAVLHDYYCGTMQYSWKETHRMFYDALITLGVGQAKAKLMYYAVYLAGPKWEVAASSAACDPSKGDNCLMSASRDGRAMAVSPDRFGELDMEREMRPAENMLTVRPEVSLEELEGLADRTRPVRDGAEPDGRPRHSH